MAALQVLGPRILAQSPQVHDPIHTLAGGHLGEVDRGAALALVEIRVPAAAHRVHEVERHLGALSGSPQGVRIEDVTAMELHAACRQRAGLVGIAHQAAHLPPSIGEGGSELPSDEPRRSRYQCPARHPGAILALGP